MQVCQRRVPLPLDLGQARRCIIVRPFTRMTLSTASVRHAATFPAARGVRAREHLGTLNVGPRGGSCFYGATARGEVSAVQSDTRLAAARLQYSYLLLVCSLSSRPVSSQD